GKLREGIGRINSASASRRGARLNSKEGCCAANHGRQRGQSNPPERPAHGKPPGAPPAADVAFTSPGCLLAIRCSGATRPQDRGGIAQEQAADKTATEIARPGPTETFHADCWKHHNHGSRAARGVSGPEGL